MGQAFYCRNDNIMNNSTVKMFSSSNQLKGFLDKYILFC